MNETTDASTMFAPIWRRKWLILAVGVLVALGTYYYYRHRTVTWEASTQIYLAAGAEEEITASGSLAALGRKTGLEGTAQAALINSPIIKTAVKAKLRKSHKSKAVRAALRGKAKAKASEKTAFVTVTAEAKNRKGAELLADVTAETYVARQNARYRNTVAAAATLTRREIQRLVASQEAEETAVQPAKSSGKHSSGSEPAKSKGSGASTSNALQIANLSSKLNQLEGNLNVRSVRQISQATAKDISTSPKRNAIFGLLVGLVLASLLAYVLARFDRTMRTLGELEAALELEILSALPTTRNPIVVAEGQPRPSRAWYESLGRLHTSLRVAAAGRGNGQPARPRTVLFTSAESGAGQSTIIAGLALVERDAGSSVAVVEADLRRPSLSRLLGVGERPGLVDVLEGRLALAEATQNAGAAHAFAPLSVDVPAPIDDAGGAPPVAGREGEVPGASGVAVQAPRASLSVLVGRPVDNPAALLSGAAMADTLQALSGLHDQVLIDAPPPLEVGDSIPLLTLADAVVVVARAGHTTEAGARRLMQLLRRSTSAPVLGVVANGVSPRESRRYGFSTYSPVWRGRFGRR